MEGRGHRNTEPFEGKMAETSRSTTVSTKLERIAKQAREMPQAALTTLAHHIDIDWLREAYRRTRKDGATGIDRQTADEYARNAGGKSPLAARARQVRQLPSAAGSEGPHPEGRWVANAAHRHSHLRGQGPSARGGDGAGGRLRAGVFWTARTASGRVALRIRRCESCRARR